jgi:hypothetical protein
MDTIHITQLFQYILVAVPCFYWCFCGHFAFINTCCTVVARRVNRFGYLKTVFLERRSETRTQSRLSKKTVFVLSRLNKDGTLCPAHLAAVRMYFDKTKSHQSTSSDDNSNNSNNNNSDNCNNDNKNSNNTAATTARIYFNKKSRRQRPQGRTIKRAPSNINQRPDDARRFLSGHPQLPEAISRPASAGLNKRICKLLIPRWSSSASSFPLATTKTSCHDDDNGDVGWWWNASAVAAAESVDDSFVLGSAIQYIAIENCNLLSVQCIVYKH